ncbi:MAG: NUDIX hydrolase [Oligoflexus sp.]
MKIRERASTICLQDNRLLTVLLEDPHLKLTRLYLPGGEIERKQGEKPAEAAVRETREETGYQVKVWEKKGQTLDYDFFWNGVHVPCRTHFFPAELLSPHAAEPLWASLQYERGVEWMPLARLIEEFSYHPRILHMIETILQDKLN